MTNKFDGIENELGVLYPKGFIVALFANGGDATAAAADLTAAGFTDVRLFTPDEVLNRVAAVKMHQSLLQKIETALSEEQVPADKFLEDVRRGAHTVMVHAEDKNHIDRARPILKAHNFTKGGHYGTWTMTELR
jgi:hypothetical protein